MGRKKITQYAFSNKPDIQERLIDALELFELNGAAYALQGIKEVAAKDKLDHYQFLERLLEEEINKKEDERVERWTKQAKFPWVKTIEQYDFNFPKEIDKEKVLQLTECAWINNGGNVIFLGPPGVGKTHLSIALGLKAITKNFETKFMTVDKLTEAISIAIGKDKEQGGGQNRKKLLHSIVNVPLLILDELAYSTISPEVSELLFQIIHQRHNIQKSIVLTANESFDKWDRLFAGNKERASAAIDRLLGSGIPVSIKGDSYRQKKL